MVYKKISRKVFFPVIMAVICLTGTGTAAAGDYARFFTGIDGWEKPDEVDVYVPDNLWDIINGAADVFMAYDFQTLYWGEYTKSSDSDIYIVLEIYRQGDPVNAFGVYSQERPRSPQLIDIGVQGYNLPGVLHFFVADCYVKIRSHDRSEETAMAMEKIARHVSDAIDSDPSFPAQLSILPEENKVRFSEEFINTNFLGHPFLSRAFVSTYEIEGERFNLFMIDTESREKSREMLSKYYEFSKQEHPELREGVHLIDDRWNGQVGIVWKDNSLYGFYNLENKELQEKYLDFFAEN
jgi:hypothetical protein